MDRIVVVTGSTRGIGFATAAEFLKHGDRVVIFCRHRKHVDEGRETLSSIGKGEQVLGLVGDVRKRKDGERIIEECLEHFGRIDVLVNNAGVAAYKPIEATTDEDWDRIIDTNLKGTFLFLRHVIPVMKKQTTGVIINISSGLGVEGSAGFSAYCASKFGVVGLTQVAADELTRIRDSGLCGASRRGRYDPHLGQRHRDRAFRVVETRISGSQDLHHRRGQRKIRGIDRGIFLRRWRVTASGCTERNNEGPCMADRSGNAVAAAKVNLPAHRAGLPGKEEFCFFVCPLSPPPQHGLRVARGQVDAIKGPSSPPGAFATLRGGPR